MKGFLATRSNRCRRSRLTPRSRRRTLPSGHLDVLLINPNREQIPWPVIPVGLCTVASALRRAGHFVDFLDLTFSRDPARDVRSKLSRDPAPIVGIGIRNLDNCNFEHPVFFLPEIRDAVIRPIRELAPAA